MQNIRTGGYWGEKSKYGLIGKRVILGVAAVWDKRKGLSDFVELSKCLDAEYQIFLVGLSEEQINRLPADIKGLRKTESVAQLAALYSIADVFVNPTYEDNFPTTNIEALACGVTVITYNTGGSVEIPDSKCGFIVERGDISDLRCAIDKVCELDKDNALQRAKKYNKYDKYMEYVQLYEKIKR